MTIKDINEIIKAICPNDEDYEKPIISPKYLRQELEQLALEQEHRHLEKEPRWIPVSERYPQIEDEYKYFLVTDDKGKVSVQEFFISLDEEPQPYFSGMVNVIAWMPLPQPYKAESEG